MNFRSYKLQLRHLLNNLSSVLQPIDEYKTALSSWNSCFRLPTYTTEPYFINRFGQPADLKSSDEIAEIALDTRDASVKNYKAHSPDPVLNSKKFAKALDITRGSLALIGNSFSPLDINAAAALSSRSTSSGFPDYLPKSDISEFVLTQATMTWHERDASFTDIPVTLAWRTQQRKTGLKFRLIWLVPYITIIYETLLFQPIVNYISTIRNTSYCIGNVYNDLQQRYIKLQRFNNIYSLDYELFDATISPFFINLFFSFNKEHLNLNPMQNWLFERIREFHLNAVIITGYQGEATVYRKRNGLLSGSFVTNYLGSFVNLFCVIYFMVDHDIEVTSEMISVMGDDSLFGLNEYFDLEYIEEYFLLTFGLKINISKSQVFGPGEPVFFLGAFIDSNKRYIDIDLVREQLKITTSFNTDLSEFDRVFSKLCSSLFKYTDGWRYFKQEIPKLLDYFGLDHVPDLYFDMSTPAGGPIPGNKIRSVSYFMYDGWRLQ